MKSVEINVNGVELANWRRKSNFKDRNKVEELADLCDTCFTSLKNWWKEKKGSFR